jgi:hypothetical protein
VLKGMIEDLPPLEVAVEAIDRDLIEDQSA